MTTKLLTARLDEGLIARFREKAKLEKRRMSEVLKALIEGYLEGSIDTKGEETATTMLDDNLEDTIDNHLDTKLDTLLEGKLDTHLDSKLESIIDTKLDTHLDSKLESIIDTKLDSVLDSKLDTHLDAKLDTLLDSKLDTHLDAKFNSVIEGKLDTHLEAKLDSIIDTKLDTHLEDKLESIIDTKLDTLLDPHLETHLDAKLDTLLDTKIAAIARTKNKSTQSKSTKEKPHAYLILGYKEGRAIVPFDEINQEEEEDEAISDWLNNNPDFHSIPIDDVIENEYKFVALLDKESAIAATKIEQLAKDEHLQNLFTNNAKQNMIKDRIAELLIESELKNSDYKIKPNIFTYIKNRSERPHSGNHTLAWDLYNEAVKIHSAKKE